MKSFQLITCLILLFFYQKEGIAKGNLIGKVKFASVAEASKLLNTNDEYISNLSRFDLDSRSQKANATREEHFKNMTAQLREWSNDEIAKLNEGIVEIDKKILNNSLKLNLPQEIIFIKSTLIDEGGAEGYTRSNCIVLKDDIISIDQSVLQDLIIHELFHVLTRHSLAFRKEMYSIIGFKLTNEIPYPDELKDFRISNPDAPKKDSYISLEKDSVPVDCMMILFSDREYSGGSFFDYLNIGLLKLKGRDRKEIDYVNGKSVIYSIEEVTGFFEQIGKNTTYIIDPEEALADNFVFAINNRKDMPSQWIVDKIISKLKG
jgi:hypothetical protein